MSRFNSDPADSVWFVHAPAKAPAKGIPGREVAPSSQIPYLNGVMDTEDDKTKETEIWFKETDTPFIRLSKVGGRHDLLVHKTKAVSEEPVGYPQPEWWTDMLVDVNNPVPKQDVGHVFEVPAWFAHADKSYDVQKVKASIQPRYDLDPEFNPKLQKYDAIEEPLKYGQLRNYKNPQRVKLASNKQKKVFETNNSQANFIRKIGETPVSMPKLLANFYQSERPTYGEWKDKQKK